MTIEGFVVQHAIPLAPFTTYKIGGPADSLVTVTSEDELVRAVLAARSQGVPFMIVGLGANMLVSDKGFRGLVIVNRYQAFSFDEGSLQAGSGAVIADLISEAKGRGLSGLEHYAGIPSTVGGALWQNLHFLSPERDRTLFIAEILQSARILNGAGEIEEVGPEFFQFGYDESILRDNPELIALSATFSLQPEKVGVLEERIKANLDWRAARHPNLQAFPSCGSIFKKIEGVGAGRLIEQVGLKGKVIGGAQISEQHANFIVNIGGAKAADVLSLIELVQTTVERETGHRLEPEIHLVGEQ